MYGGGFGAFMNNEQEWGQVHNEHRTFSCTSVYFLCSFEMSVSKCIADDKNIATYARNSSGIFGCFLFTVFISKSSFEFTTFLMHYYSIWKRYLANECQTRSHSEVESSFSTKWCFTFSMFKFSTWIRLSARKIECLTVVILQTIRINVLFHEKPKQ